tara:strand:- start:653 stop:3148 length:2496 start_codon:yes stop_codon:yes gene_type:complete
MNMSFEERKQEFIEAYKQAKIQNKVSRWSDDFQDDYEDAIEAEGLDFDEYLDEIISEGDKSADAGPQYFPPAQIDKIDKQYFKNIKYGSGNLKYNNLISNFNVNKVTPNFTYIKDDDDLEELLGQLEIVEQLLSKQGMEGVSQLQQVMIKLSADVANMPDPSKLKKVTLTIDGMLDEINDVDITLSKDRDTIYTFWDKVNDEWSALETSWKQFTKELKNTDFWSNEEHGLTIPELPKYVINVKSPRIKLEKEQLRLLKVMEMLGGKLPLGMNLKEYEEGARNEAKNYLTQLQRPGPNTEQGQRINEPVVGESVVIRDAPKAISSSDMEDIFGRTARDWKEKLGKVRGQMSELALEETDLLTKNKKVDPILYYIIEAQLFDDISIPIAFDESDFFKEYMKEFLQYAYEKSTDSEYKNAMNIWEQIMETSAESEYDSVYLPYTDWLVELMEGEDGTIKQQDYANLNQSAEDFFAFLNDVLIESKGQFMVSQSVSDVMSGSGAPPLQAGKKTPPKTGMRMDRAQPFRPSIKRKFDEETFNTAIKNLIESMDKYYFGPLTSNMFAEDEKPDFAEDVRNYDFRNLKMNFSQTDEVKAEQEILDGYAENITITDLQELINFFETIRKGGEESWPIFIQALEDIVEILDELLPEKFEEDNRNWAADYASTIATRNYPDVDLSTINFMGKNLSEYDKLDSRKPITRLRTLLSSEQMNQILRKEQKFREISGKKLQELVNKFLEVSSPSVRKSDEINDAIMNAYDVIRKSAGLKIYYGELFTDDISDMDYLINRIHKEDKVEVTTIEIDSIVKSHDSMQNLSSNYGLSGEIIYKIKGLCR